MIESTRNIRRLLWAVFFCVGLLSAAHAETAYVSDQFEITLRTGPSTRNAITKTLSSGTAVDVLESDEESGWSHVQAGDAEGWVLTRYLMDQPAARAQLSRLQQRAAAQEQRLNAVNGQLSEIKDERDKLLSDVSDLEKENMDIRQQLQQVRQASASALETAAQNKDLRQQLAAQQQASQELQRINSQLSRQARRNWFVAGAGVLLLGLLLGLILPRIRWRRRTSDW